MKIAFNILERAVQLSVFPQNSQVFANMQLMNDRWLSCIQQLVKRISLFCFLWSKRVSHRCCSLLETRYLSVWHAWCNSLRSCDGLPPPMDLCRKGFTLTGNLRSDSQKLINWVLLYSLSAEKNDVGNERIKLSGNLPHKATLTKTVGDWNRNLILMSLPAHERAV